MSALTTERDTQMIIEPAQLREFTVADNTRIWSGSIVAIDTGDSNKAKPGAASTTLIAVGRAEHTANNLTGAEDPVTKIKARAGTFLFANSSSGDAITNADIGADCYIADDQTVAKTDGGTAQVTEATVVYSVGDATGFTITGVDATISVTAATSASATATALAKAANANAQFFTLYTASTNSAKVVVTKKTSGTFTMTKSVAGAADLTPITNTTAGVATARSKAGKVWKVESAGVWVRIGLN